MPEPKDEQDRTTVPAPDRPAPPASQPEQNEAIKGATRLPRKGDELDDLHGTPTD